MSVVVMKGNSMEDRKEDIIWQKMALWVSLDDEMKKKRGLKVHLHVRF